ncbi:biotin-dependent carboxyltransferase family protein [Rhizobium sp. SSA_523]|uniref:5-oxoprolinase subunit C family protein n=1 Tax=Rhizobium sp. SSA_523 TaxID=2952477 RepID=UPI0020908B60|nr:biotin-dependent carboxyltransferase family protein [Rhizobium sp. SSA_523]MCO5731189.1 biotin-dependent carboxyltransferase family protein [Rhizobium sp. SSA_523]WKC22268.1 biotin-dependent carboxyltransferase family protein [Rhizobium sp. SSA_523]
MMPANCLSILRCGPLVTIQDGGRHGYRSFGLSPSGPVDRDSQRIANRLVGNREADACLEFALVGGVFKVERDCLFAVTGGRCAIDIDGQPRTCWESHVLRRGETLTVGALEGAVWGYLAISGGIVTEPVLGSRSTHLRTGVGGLGGRVLAAGDLLPLGHGKDMAPKRLGSPYLRSQAPIRIIAGPQDDYFDASTWSSLLSRPFSPTPARDRMAMVLEGPQICAFKGHDIVSDATLAGSIQVPGSGKPIVLTADGQTTGGYPKIATIASADLLRLAQMPNGQKFRFRRISADAAEDLLLDAQDRLADVLDTIERDPG